MMKSANIMCRPHRVLHNGGELYFDLRQCSDPTGNFLSNLLIGTCTPRPPMAGLSMTVGLD